MQGWWCRMVVGRVPTLSRLGWASLALAGVALGSAALAAPDWGDAEGPAPGPARAIGGHSLGCLAGGVELPADGPGWQVMRPSRNRFYGHPELIRFIGRLAEEAQRQGFGELLVGDLAQPRGGPMTSGHVSHQTGLDADIWLRPAPGRTLASEERETFSAISMVDGEEAIDGAHWSEAHTRLLRAAARDPAVARIFVHPAIKGELCATAGTDRDWLRRIRPWWGHDHHFHVRLRCPDDDPWCVDQDPPPPGDGCDESLAWWFSDEARAEAERLAALPPRPRPTLDDLPPQCRAVLVEP